MLLWPRVISLGVAMGLAALALLCGYDQVTFFGIVGKVFSVGSLSFLSLAAMFTFVLTFGFEVVFLGKVRAIPSSKLGRIACYISPKMSLGMHFCDLYTRCLQWMLAVIVVSLSVLSVLSLLFIIGYGLIKEPFEFLRLIAVVGGVGAILVFVSFALYVRFPETFPKILLGIAIPVLLGIVGFVFYCFIIAPVMFLQDQGLSLGQSIAEYGYTIGIAVGALPLCIGVRYIVKKLPASFSSIVCPVVFEK